ncbi:MAG: dipeptidase [Pseudomonadales bacterium]
MTKKLSLFIASLLLLALLLHLFAPAIVERGLNRVEPHNSFMISSEAKDLHNSLFIADLHSDSLLWSRNLMTRATRGHVDLPRLREGNVGLQVFSAVTKSPRGLNDVLNESSSDNVTLLAIAQAWPVATWNSLYARAAMQLARLNDLVVDYPEELMFVRTQSDLRELLEAQASGKSIVGAQFLIEGAHSLDGEIANLETLHQQGLQFVGITHFFDNKLGGSLHGISKDGLTDFGKKVVRRADALGMNIDIAHASPQAVRDVLEIATRPVILSHGGFKGACDSPRNLDDSLMQQVANHGAIIGVGYWASAVCDYSPLGIVKSIRYGIELLGLQHIALGSDFDGTVTTQFDTSELAVLTQTMLDEHFTENEIRAVMGENVKRFLLHQLPKKI